MIEKIFSIDIIINELIEGNWKVIFERFEATNNKELTSLLEKFVKEIKDFMIKNGGIE